MRTILTALSALSLGVGLQAQEPPKPPVKVVKEKPKTGVQDKKQKQGTEKKGVAKTEKKGGAK